MSIRYASAVLLGLFAHVVCAQTHWADRMGAWSNDAFNDVAIDASGDIYAVGEFGGNIELDGATLISQGSLDAVVAKYNAQGGLLWVRTFGGPGLDRAIKLALTSDGSIAVVGQFMATVAFDGTTVVSQGGTQDMFVIKMAQADGAVAWARQGGSPDGVDQPNGVSIGPDGSIAVAGEFRGTAVFDAGTITSIIDPENGLPSVDIFLAIYASDGTAQWLKHGAAEFADRGMDVAHDPAGNVYLTGQFSDTLTFDITHNNAMYSAVFLMRFSPTGQEQWFRRFGGGTYNQVFEMLMVEGNRLLLVGDVQGTVIFLDTDPDLFTVGAPRSSFLLEVGLDGELMQHNTWGSDHNVNTRALSVQGNDIAVLGRFTCQFTDFSTHYGEGTFLATGDNDLYIARFQLADLGFKEAQQFGGQGDKVPGGIVHTPDAALVFSGSYEYTLIFPSNSSFSVDPGQPALTPSVPIPYCNDADYNKYMVLRGSALKDGFLARGYVDGREPYDIFQRTGNVCDRTQKDIVIRAELEGVLGPDSLRRCIGAFLQAITPTSYTADTSVKHTSPMLAYAWSTGATTRNIQIYLSGWYHVTVSSVPGCWQRTDSVFVTVDPVPPVPLISDDVVVNVNASPTTSIEVCEPQQPWLWATGIEPGNAVVWSGPGGVNVANDSVQAAVTGPYTVTTTTIHGCYRTNVVNVTIIPSGPLPPIDVDLIMDYPQDGDNNDTAYICQNDLVFLDVLPLLTLNGNPTDVPYGVSMYTSCGGGWVFDGTVGFNCTDAVLNEGWYYRTVGFMLTNTPCGEDTLIWEATDSLYVVPLEVFDPVVELTGPALICPGDTALLVASCTGCSSLTWNGSFIQTSGDSAWVVQPGSYTISGLMVDANGCSTTASAVHLVDWNPLPLLGVDPSDGIICPNSTATIWSEAEGLQYQWYGPMGPLSVDNDTIITSQQGFYYLEMVDSLFCNVTSDPILITDYATPFLNVLPDGVLCEEDETATLYVVTTSTATLVWDAPFAGSTSLEQLVTQPGIYTCWVNACDITTELSVEILGNTSNAELVVPGPFTVCPGTELVLEALPGQALYYWLPGPQFGPLLPVDTSGTYILITTDGNGCQDTLATEVEFLPDYEVLAVQDTSYCVGEMQFVTVAGDGTFMWYADAQLTQVIGTGTQLDLGVATATDTVWVVQEVGICSSGGVMVRVHVYLPVEPPVVLGDVSVCEGSVLQLSTQGQAEVTYTWTSPVQTYSGNTIIIDPLNMAHAGQWSVVGSNLGCDPELSTFNVIVIDAAPMDLGPDTVICPGGTAQFVVPPGFTQPFWHDATSAPLFTTSTAGEVSLAAVDGNGCTVRDTAVVIIFGFTQPLNVSGTTICLGQNATLVANGSGDINWYGDAQLSQLVHEGATWYIQQPADSTVYYVTQSQGACVSGSQTVLLAVVPIPIDATIEGPDYFCAGGELVLSVTGTGAPSGYWSTPTGPMQGATIVIPDASTANVGTYTVVPFIGSCAGDTLSVQVTMVQPDALYIGPDTAFCAGGSLQVSLPPGFTEPVWSGGSSTWSFNVTEAGTYSVQALDAHGCVVGDAMVIEAVECDGIVPNIFTPNGDGVNDVWILGPGGYTEAVLDVYNRWGQLVWKGDVVRVGFNGEHMDNGEPLSEGTYYYVLTLTRGNGTAEGIAGHLTLLR